MTKVGHDKSPWLLRQRDWVYLLSLLVPFAVYDLVSKGRLVFGADSDSEFVGRLTLMQSSLLFNLAYMFLWVGLFGVTRNRRLRWVVAALVCATTIFIALIKTFAYQYFAATGEVLDAEDLLLGLRIPKDTGTIIQSEVTAGKLMLILAILVYVLVGPPLVAYVVGRWRKWPGIESWNPKTARARRLRALGAGLVALALFACSLFPGGGSTRVSKSFARDAFANMLLTGVEMARAKDPLDVVADLPARNTRVEVKLLPAASAKRRNVVVIFLESTRAAATTPYNKSLQTMPFMEALGKISLLAERAYAVVPHTHNAIAATMCGIEPPLDPQGTALLSKSGSMPGKCLPHMLNEQRYNTAFFMSQESWFENSPQIMENLGFKEFYSVEHMNTAGFERTNYFGYEDDILLEPSRRWLQQNRDKPFLAAYLTSAPHHEYLAPQKRYGRVEFTKNDLVNRYLNAVRNEDFFLKKLFDLYKQLDLYKDTVFIILGDHGEGFGEHGRFIHNQVIYDEGLRIPLLIHDPQRFERGTRFEEPVSQMDVLPTVADLLGYAIQSGAYAGSSLLRPLPQNRTLMFSCWSEKWCLARLKGTEKFIYHFDDSPDELFDLATDPAERKNLALQLTADEINTRRSELLKWQRKVRSRYHIRPSG